MSQMNSATRNLITGNPSTLGVAALLAAFTLACGGDTDRGRRGAAADQQNNQGGTANLPTGAAGNITVPSGGSGGTPVAPGAPPTTPQVCGLAAPAMDGVLLDFSEYTLTSGAWGNAVNMHTTGGTSPYSCAESGACPATADPVLALADDVLNVTATIPAGQYSGMVFWFTPCLNPSTFDGISMMLGGNLAGAQLAVKPQAHLNYPVDAANMKGGCLYTAEATKWSECTPPQVIVTATTEALGEQRFFWADFEGGVPLQTPALDPATGIVGLELQFQCQATEGNCEINVNFGTITWLPEGSEPLTPPDPPPEPDAGVVVVPDAG